MYLRNQRGRRTLGWSHVCDFVVLVLSKTVLVLVIESRQPWVQNSDFLAVGCGLNNCFGRTRTQQSGTQCNGTRTRWLFELRRCRSWIEAGSGYLRTDRPDCYTGSLRVRVEVRTMWCTEVAGGAFFTF
jgi:hypothetical protein